MKSSTKIKKRSFKLLVIIASLPFLFFSLKYLCIGLYRFQNYMSSWEAAFTWGRTPFDAEKFRESPTNERAKMMANLLSNRKDFFGKTKEEVTRVFGIPHEDYSYNSRWGYKIYEYKKHSWYLTFESFEGATEIAHKIYVYKRCCSVTRSMGIAYVMLLWRWSKFKDHRRAIKARRATRARQTKQKQVPAQRE